MRYLSHSTERNIPWTSHNAFPKGTIKNRDSTYARAVANGWFNPERLKDCLKIYKFSEDENTITLIPEEEWESHSG